MLLKFLSGLFSVTHFKNLLRLLPPGPWQRRDHQVCAAPPSPSAPPPPTIATTWRSPPPSSRGRSVSYKVVCFNYLLLMLVKYHRGLSNLLVYLHIMCVCVFVCVSVCVYKKSKSCSEYEI